MKIKDALRTGTRQLQDITNVPTLEAEVLLAYVLRCDRLWLLTHIIDNLAVVKQRRYYRLLNHRQNGQPIAYLIHNKEFYGRDFYVNRYTLIPRADSEPIVDAVIKLLWSKNKARILEVGTGSGCLAITLALEIPLSQIVATDISRGALKVAKINVHTYQVTSRITLKQQNLLTKENGWYDLLWANLPYVPLHWLKNSPQAKKLSAEPLTALSGGINGLDLITKLLQQIVAKPVTPIVVLEHGDNQQAAIKKLVQRIIQPLKMRTIKDLTGRDRGLIIWLKVDKST